MGGNTQKKAAGKPPQALAAMGRGARHNGRAMPYVRRYFLKFCGRQEDLAQTPERGAGEAVKNKPCYSRGLAFRGRSGRHKSPPWAGGMLSRQAQSSAQRSRRRQQPFRQQGRTPVTGGAFFFRQLLAVPAAAGPGHGQQPGQGDLFAAVHAQARPLQRRSPSRPSRARMRAAHKWAWLQASSSAISSRALSASSPCPWGRANPAHRRARCRRSCSSLRCRECWASSMGKTSGGMISRQDTPVRAPGHGEVMTLGVRSCEKKPRVVRGFGIACGGTAGISGGSC